MTHPGARGTICVRTPSHTRFGETSPTLAASLLRSCQPRRISYYTLLFTLLLTVTHTRLGDLPGTFPILSTLPVTLGRTLVSKSMIVVCVYLTISSRGLNTSSTHFQVRRLHSMIFIMSQRYPRITGIRPTSFRFTLACFPVPSLYISPRNSTAPP